MNEELKSKVENYVRANISSFHENRIEKLKELKLDNLLKRKNPYLYKAKDLNTPEAIVRSLASAFISSAEETMFGDWLEGLAIYVAKEVFGGVKSSALGIDLEMDKDGTHYFVSIKSGPNWSNSSSLKKLKEYFVQAQRVYRTSGNRVPSLGVEGCCYGIDTSPTKTDGHLKLCGKLFWDFISGEENMYTDIIEPLGTDATQKNEEYTQEYNKMITRFTQAFVQKYADEEGNLLWEKIVKKNSGYPEGFTY